MRLIPVWFFPSCLIAINLLSSLRWAMEGNWRRSVYWLAAAVLNFVVTF